MALLWHFSHLHLHTGSQICAFVSHNYDLIYHNCDLISHSCVHAVYQVSHICEINSRNSDFISHNCNFISHRIFRFHSYNFWNLNYDYLKFVISLLTIMISQLGLQKKINICIPCLMSDFFSHLPLFLVIVTLYLINLTSYLTIVTISQISIFICTTIYLSEMHYRNC